VGYKIFHRRAKMVLSFCIATTFTSSAIAEEAAPIEVTTLKASLTENYDPLTMGGFISPGADYELVSPISGLIKSIQVKSGSKVKAGSPLFSIHGDTTGFDTKPFTMKAPIGGIVNLKIGQLGRYVTAGEKLGQIADSTKLTIRAGATLSDINQLNLGESLITYLRTDQPSKTLDIPSEITGISSIADPETGLFFVEIAIHCPTNSPCRQWARPGLFASVTARKNQRKSYLIPISALKKNKTAVLLVNKDSKAEFREVTLGKYSDDQVEILSGLNVNELVVQSFAKLPKEGDPLKVPEQSDEQKGIADKGSEQTTL
jgi:multidrug efflux pump subunit AcrA (membrane-fusion protein)